MTTLRLGLTGGIGSGKSSVATLLVNHHGVTLIDADAIARQVTASGGAALPAIRAHFGDTIFTPEGDLDRASLRALVFRDPEARHRLEGIVHPLVAQQSLDALQIAESRDAPCVVLDIPLLLESGHWRERVHRVLVVDCEPSVQQRRVRARSGLAPTEVERIIASQMPRVQRLTGADAVLDNSGDDLDQLRTKVAELAALFGLSSTPPTASSADPA